MMGNFTKGATRRGSPPKGKSYIYGRRTTLTKVTSTLSPEHLAFVRKLGEGYPSRGIRLLIAAQSAKPAKQGEI